MLRADGLTRDYGRTRALLDVSFHVPAGQTVALLGANGAGKSTLLNILAGVLSPTSGTATVVGVELPRDRRRIGAMVGFVPQGESLYRELTVSENVRFFARSHGVSRADIGRRLPAVLERMGLADRGDQRAGTLSGGLRQRAAIAASLLHEPRVLLLDEPTTGLDPVAREKLLDLLSDLTRQEDTKRCVLMCTHDVHDAARVANRALVLVGGRLVHDSPGIDEAALSAAFRQEAPA